MLAQGHNAMTLVRLEPAASQSQVKLSTTELLRSLSKGFLYLSLKVGWFLLVAAGEANPGGHSVLVLGADNPQDYQQFCDPPSIFLSLK